MSIFVPLCTFALGFCIGGAGGIVLGFVWYERKCGLLSDRTGQRAAAIRAELDDIYGPHARRPGDGHSGIKTKFAAFHHQR